MNDYTIRTDCDGVDWQRVADILREAGMAHHAPALHRRAFEHSAAVAFAWDGDTLVGFARAISDGVYQAAVYDVAVLPVCQGRGVGRVLLRAVLAQVKGCSVILYASPGKEGFYEKEGFARMKTGMALFADAARMRGKGFI